MRPTLAIAVTLAFLLVAASASADPTKSTYTEAKVEGGTVITFEKDAIGGGNPTAYGDTIRKPPGVIRVGLIRPRFNFVPELLKSVENL